MSDSSGNTGWTAESKTSSVSDPSDSKAALDEQQEGLPEEIKSKTYPSSDLLSAEDELFQDLQTLALLDSDKLIVLNNDGKASWSMPSVFHQDALQKLLTLVNKQSSGAEDPLLARADIRLPWIVAFPSLALMFSRRKLDGH